LLEYQGSENVDLTTLGAAPAADQAYEQSGTGPDDIDTLQIHTNFTHIGLMQLEDLGFCEKGKGGEFVRNGGISFEDGIPMNTNGGPLSFGQSSISPETMVEAVRQLRGDALGLQVNDPESALVHIIGGVMACHTVTILSTRRH
jgi:acetyl-CoA acetyltransferase